MKQNFDPKDLYRYAKMILNNLVIYVSDFIIRARS